MKVEVKAKQVKRLFVTKAAWLDGRKKKVEQHCTLCKVPYLENDDTHVGMAVLEGERNIHICSKCGDELVANGAQDIDALVAKEAQAKSALIEELKALGYAKSRHNDLLYMSIETLTNEISSLRFSIEERQRLEKLIAQEYVETPTEPYLVEDWGVIEIDYLKHHSEIMDTDWGNYVTFNCGQGYYEDEKTVIAKIGAKFYSVELKAEVYGTWQDRGAKLYYVDRVMVVSYQEIPKPMPKQKYDYALSITCNEGVMDAIQSFLRKNGITYKVTK